MRAKVALLGVLVALGGASGIAAAVTLHRAPAKATSPAIPVKRDAPSLRAEGRVVARPGASVTLSSEILGTVTHVNVVEGQRVKRGDLLLEFRRAEHLAQLDHAWAASGEATARLRARTADVKRAKVLVTEGAVPERERDVATEERNVARSRLQVAAAETAQVRAVLERTRITSPIDGVATRPICW